MKSTRVNPFQSLRDRWAIMTFYERFEQIVALVQQPVSGTERQCGDCQRRDLCA